MNASVTVASMMVKSTVGGIGKNPIGEGGTSVGGEETDGVVKKVPMSVMDGVAVGGVAASCGSMFLVGSPLVGAASVMTVGFCPYAAYQKRKVDKIGGFRGLLNETRGQVDQLSIENDKLRDNVDKLEEGVSKLEEVEKGLAELCDTSNVDRLVYIVKENGRIQKEIKEKLEAQVMQNVMSVVLQADRNNDLMMGPKELNMLCFRMNNMPGVDFNEQLFRGRLMSRKSISGSADIPIGKIMEVFRNLLDDDVPEEENIFKMDAQQLLQEQ